MQTLRKLLFGSMLAAMLACAGVSAQQPAETTKPAPTPPPISLPGGTIYDPLIQPNGVVAYQASPFWGRGGDSQSEAMQLAQQLAKSDKEEEKKDLRKKLGDMLSKQFDQHAQQQQKELEELEKEINRLRSVLKKRQDAKSTIVERRLEQLVQDAEGLGWNAPNSPRSSGFGGRAGAFGGFGAAPPALTAPRIAPPSAERR
jgi:hypothetical protein